MNVNKEFITMETKPYKPSVDDLAVHIARCADPETSIEFLAEIDNRIRFMKEKIKDYEKSRDEAFKERIKACDGAGFTLGYMRYRLVTPTETKCRDVGECLKSILELLGPEGAALCLSSSAWKYGQARTMLEESGNAEVFDALFETRKKEVLKGEPITDKQLISIDERFIKQPKGKGKVS